MMVPHNLHLQMLEDGDEDYVMEKKQIPDKKRKIHKTSEQKGRQKINSQINYLKSLLPECASVVTTKAFILERAVDTLRRLQSAVDQMQSFNKKIAKENQRMTEECERQRKLFGISSTNPFSSPILSQRKGLLGSGNSFHFGSSQEDISLSNVKVEPFELFMNGGGLEEFGLETPIDFPNNPFSLSLPSSQEDLGASSGLNDGYSFGNFSTMDDNSFSKFQFELPADGSFGSLLGFQNNDSPSLKRQRMV